MLFNSFEYLLLFLPLTVSIYFVLNRRIGVLAGKLWLVTASLFFYGWWSLSYLWLICGSMLFNYLLGGGIAHWREQRGNRARLLLTIAIVGNLALLGYYKYADFFISNINLLRDTPSPLLNIALPLGISFFTIQQIAYLVDVYEGVVVEKSIIDYGLFVTFFPHLLAGPILHHKEMMPQFADKNSSIIDWENIYIGLFIIGIGLLKKVLLASSLSSASDAGFNSASSLAFHDAWITSLSYSMQIYFDFSGYTDMAIGAALLFNIHLPENFNSPFKAINLQDYWKRWHITLTRFITSYIYTPLVRYTAGSINFQKSMIATFFAMCVAGLWHGASWHYVLFGVMHGAGLVVSHTWHRLKFNTPNWLGWTVTFLFVNMALVIFRADNMVTASNVLKSMLGLNGFDIKNDLAMWISGLADPGTWDPFSDIGFYPARKILILLSAILIVFFAPNTLEICRSKYISSSKYAYLLTGSAIGIGLFYMLFMTSGIHTFIYFYF
ncbi:MAG TPA: MBOAT family O-acyltransferase [Pseudomonadales bacterium]|nr:MBOAT family O-acyltransferase [Pseudomonadales bacterium]